MILNIDGFIIYCALFFSALISFPLQKINDDTYTKSINGVVSLPIWNLIKANMLNNTASASIIAITTSRATFTAPNLRYNIA